MKRKVWVIGHVAEDLVLKIDREIGVGQFHAPHQIIRRCGGSTANVAIGLASGPIDTSFVTYLGNDDTAERIEPVLKNSGFENLIIKRGEDATPICLVAIDKHGERTLILLTIAPKKHGGMSFKGSGIAAGDIVLFTHWQEEWREEVEYAKSQGCIIVMGLNVLNAVPDIAVDIVIGSISDIPKELPFQDYIIKYPVIVVTYGKDGSKMFTKDGVIHQEAIPVKTIDTTGAGDSFLAGFLTAYALGLPIGKEMLEIGARWASLMVTVDASIPPNFDQIAGVQEIIDAALARSK
jgi:sugar/nucleoside kinase (ribokinase family)